jgi:ADP-ribose pyrophosphatase
MFTGRERRPIVRDPRTLEAFAEKHQVVLGVVAATPYIWLINDLVQSRAAAGTEVLHPYLRVIAPPEKDADPPAEGDAVVLATVAPPSAEASELIVMVEQERHSTGKLELELPRGFGEPGVSAADQALAELRQETGYFGEQARFLGATVSDSGTSDRSASFFHVPAIGRDSAARESSEAIARTVLLTRDELWKRIDSGAVRDAFTVQALALYERHERQLGETAAHGG